MNFGLSRSWWILVLRGVIAILFGILAIVWPGITWYIIATLFGFYALIDGFSAFGLALSGGTTTRHWWALFIEGVIGVLVGVIALVQPMFAAWAIVFWIGFWAITTGVFEIVTAIRMRSYIAHGWLMGFGGVLSILFGLVVLFSPGAGEIAIAWIIGIYALIFGITLLSLGFQMRSWGSRLPTA